MAKKALITVDGNYKKIKKGFITIDGVYKKIKKAYITIGGVYRPCWSDGKPVSYGTITSAAARSEHAATSFAGYAMFGGGRKDGNSSVNTVDIYNTSLTHSSVTLQCGRVYINAAASSTHAVFGGGWGSDASSFGVVDAFYRSLTRATVQKLPNAYADGGAAGFSNHVIFAGGFYSDNFYSGVFAYDTSLTQIPQTALSSLSVARRKIASATIGNYALFAGGQGASTEYSSAYDSVDVYDTSLSKISTNLSLSWKREYPAVATIGDYAVFGGGGPNLRASAYVDIYNTSLTHSYYTDLISKRASHDATSLGDYALFGGGYQAAGVGSVIATNSVDVLDKSLTNVSDIITLKLSQARGYLKATSVGDFALFGGGGTLNNYSAAIDVFTLL